MDRWMKVSYPFFKVEQIKTPTMFMAGEKDFNVPAIGSEQMYQALKSVGTPTRLVIYPGQFHGITRPSYRRHRLEQWVQWFDTYVKGDAGHDAGTADTDRERGALGGLCGSRGPSPAAQGLQWVREGLEIFAASPPCGSASRILFLMMGVVLSIIPFAGMLWSVVVPIHAGGLMLGCRALRQGQPLEVRYLFNGFEAPRLQPLALVGALYLAGSVIVMSSADPHHHARRGRDAAVGVRDGSRERVPPPWPAWAWSVVRDRRARLAAVMVLSLALWFAPALVVFDGVPALEALKGSLRAGWVNVGAFTVYGLVLLGSARRGIAPHRRGPSRRRPRRAGRPAGHRRDRRDRALRCLCAVLLMPATWGAMYASYEDIFERPLIQGTTNKSEGRQETRHKYQGSRE